MTTNNKFESLVKEIAEQLINNAALEPDTDGSFIYYLHIDEDGKIKNHRDNLNPSDNMLTCRAYRSDDYDTMDEMYDKETLDDPDFKGICEDLAEQYIEEYLEA